MQTEVGLWGCRRILGEGDAFGVLLGVHFGVPGLRMPGDTYMGTASRYKASLRVSDLLAIRLQSLTLGQVLTTVRG